LAKEEMTRTKKAKVAKNSLIHLSRRQRQIMDVLFRDGDATAQEIREKLPDPPSNSAVRAMLSTLEQKGHIKHREESLKYVYFATMKQETVRKTAVDRLINTFFGGSTFDAVTALLGMQPDNISDEELAELSKIIEKSKKKGL
jgi:BlaI family transcriptional regulator, penicillinase repressor